MASAGTIPRFLLPQHGHIWRRVQPGTSAVAGLAVVPAPARVRLASSSAPLNKKPRPPSAAKSPSPPSASTSKPLVLEKPLRFNPPSHGARLPNKQHMPKHYGGSLSPEALRAQSVREYPGMMAPKGTWTHWFLHSKGIHLFITLGTLTGLAIYTFVQNFKRTSPYLDMVPSLADFFWRPFASVRTLAEVFRLSTEHNSALVAEKRDKRIDDVVKRRRYRKAHGIDESEGIAGWLKGESGVVDPDEEQQAQAAPATSSDPAAATGDAVVAPLTEGEGKRKKFLGIF